MNYCTVRFHSKGPIFIVQCSAKVKRLLSSGRTPDSIVDEFKYFTPAAWELLKAFSSYDSTLAI
jgi:hypothetical protein